MLYTDGWAEFYEVTNMTGTTLKLLRIVLAFGALALLGACSSGDSGDDGSGGREVSASAFMDNEAAYVLTQSFDLTINVTTTAFETKFGRFLEDHTCEGDNTSPPLAWDGVPEGTKSLALIFEDPASDELGGEGLWTHWIVYSISPDVTELTPAQPAAETLTIGARHGSNDYKDVYYTGPCPTPTITYGANTRFTPPTVALERPYYFRVYALDKEIDLEPGANRNTILREMDNHIIAGGVAEVPYKSRRRKTTFATASDGA